MKCFFVTALFNIEIPENLGSGNEITGTTFITNSPAIISFSPEFERTVGSLEMNFIRTAPAVIYGLDDRDDSTSPDEYVLEKLSIVNSFLHSLWFLKDNAVNNQLGFVACIRKNETIIHSNELIARQSTADGASRPTVFSHDELRKASSLFKAYLGVGKSVLPGSSATNTALKRIQLALYFTAAARSNSDVGLKIVHYCSAIEALFATDKTELTHKLSERVASFLEDDPRRRLEIYKNVKKAYNNRSTIVHGERGKTSNSDKFLEAAKFLDEILRQVYSKLFTEPIHRALIELEKHEEFETHFLLRIFGASWEDLVDNK